MEKKVKLIEKIFNIKVESIKYIGSGYDSEAYEINGDYLFKFTRHKLAIDNYKKDKELLNIINNNKFNIKIPNIEYSYFSKDKAILGYKIIKGRILTREIFNSLNSSEKEKIINDLGVFLSKLHSIDYSLVKYENIELIGTKDDYDFLNKNVKLTILEKNYIDKLFNDINNSNLFNCKKCICHNDLSINHLIINDDNCLEGIIDFGDSCINYEIVDFGYLLQDYENGLGNEGLKILDKFNIDKDKVLLYSKYKEKYEVIQNIIWGIKQNNNDLYNLGINEVRRIVKNERG